MAKRALKLDIGVECVERECERKDYGQGGRRGQLETEGEHHKCVVEEKRSEVRAIFSRVAMVGRLEENVQSVKNDETE